METRVFRRVKSSGPTRTRLAALDRWQRFWFAEVPPHQFALLRIIFGLLGVLSLLGLTPVSTFWSLTGIISLSGSMAEVKAALLNWNLGTAAGLIFFAALVISFVGMTVGCLTRAAVGACFFGTVLQNHWNPLPLTGAIQVVIAVLFCLFWVDCGAVWSIDAWLRARRARFDASLNSVTAQPVWPLHLIRIQIAIVYLSSGLWKLLWSPVWRDGSALHFVLQQNAFSRLPISAFASSGSTSDCHDLLHTLLGNRFPVHVAPLVDATPGAHRRCGSSPRHVGQPGDRDCSAGS